MTSDTELWERCRSGVKGWSTKSGVRPRHLVACAKKNAGVLVFPGPDDLCGRLGLEPLSADYAQAGRTAARVYAAFTKFLMHESTVPAGGCPSPQDVADQVRSRLAKTDYSDIGLVIRQEGPCARLISNGGDAIEIFTRSRSEDRQWGLGERVESALLPLIDKTIDLCLSPARTEALAKAALERAGISTVSVRVALPQEPCVGAGSATTRKKRSRSSVRNHASCGSSTASVGIRPKRHMKGTLSPRGRAEVTLDQPALVPVRGNVGKWS